MRIIHVVTLITPDGAFGGPVRVAANQVRALREGGHDAIIVAAHQGFGDDVPEEFDGVPVRLFKARTLTKRLGFSGLVAPGMYAYVKREASRGAILHFHLARDLITLPIATSARLRRRSYVTQTHGMIDHSTSLLSKPLDLFLTQPTLRAAGRAFFLTERERLDLISVTAQEENLSFLANGVPLSDSVTSAEQHPVNGDVRVLFMARLHKRKRPDVFARAASALSPHLKASFSIVGPDEGAEEEVRRIIEVSGASAADRIRLEGPVPAESALARMDDCDIYVLPSVNEPFPMSVLEALSLGKPVIITRTCGLADAVSEAEAGIVVDHSEESLVAAMELLATDGALRARMSTNARRLVQNSFSMTSIMNTLESTYLALVK